MASDAVNEFTAGAFGGLIGLVAGHPCDTMKTVTQNVAADSRLSMAQLGRHMTSLGAATFFRGLSVPLWSYAVVNSVFFGVHKSVSKQLNLMPEAQNPDQPGWYSLPTSQYAFLMLSGATGGAVQLIPSVPVEVIKVRMQKDAHTSGPRPLVSTTVRQIYMESGLRGFYKGTSAQFFRDVPASASYFMSYEWTRRAMRRHTSLSEGPVCLIAGAIGGWISWVLLLPVDVIKTRLQSGREASMVGCVRSMLAEGPRAFIAGLGLVSLRALLVNALTFWGYEMAIKKLQNPQKTSPPLLASEQRSFAVEANTKAVVVAGTSDNMK